MTWSMLGVMETERTALGLDRLQEKIDQHFLNQVWHVREREN